jgi:hypothetical protein
MNTLATTQNALYHGVAFYDNLGRMILEVGNEVPGIASKRIAEARRHLVGKWSFSVVKIMRLNGSAKVWETAVVFPDGRVRKLKLNEIASDVERSAGIWATTEQVRAAVPSVRIAPDIRFPWKDVSIEARIEKFANLIEMENRLKSIADAPDRILFVVEHAVGIQPPDEEGIFVRMAVVTK